MTWPIRNRFCRCATLNGGADYHLLVEAHASANTKGNWTELSSALPFNSDLLQFNINNYLAADLLFDLAIGSAGSEVAILENLLFSAAAGGTTVADTGTGINLPLHIPVNTRLSARVQGGAASQSANVNAIVFQREFYGGSLSAGIDTIGAVTADSGGTGLSDCGGTAQTYGNYTEIISASLKTYKGFFIAVGLRNNTGARSGSFAVDIALGGAGSEVNIVTESCFRAATASGCFITRWTPIIWTPIPVGSRISARYKSSVTDATDRLMDLVFYCLY
jgi:hypothetical protein